MMFFWHSANRTNKTRMLITHIIYKSKHYRANDRDLVSAPGFKMEEVICKKLENIVNSVKQSIKNQLNEQR